MIKAVWKSNSKNTFNSLFHFHVWLHESQLQFNHLHVYMVTGIPDFCNFCMPLKKSLQLFEFFTDIWKSSATTSSDMTANKCLLMQWGVWTLVLPEAQISSVEIFFPSCFHQLVRTKLASDTQIDMYTIPFLWLCSCLHPHTFDVPTSIVVWCVINRMRVRFILLRCLVLAVQNHEQVKRKAGKYLKDTDFYKTTEGHLVQSSFLTPGNYLDYLAN